MLPGSHLDRASLCQRAPGQWWCLSEAQEGAQPGWPFFPQCQLSCGGAGGCRQPENGASSRSWAGGSRASWWPLLLGIMFISSMKCHLHAICAPPQHGRHQTTQTPESQSQHLHTPWQLQLAKAPAGLQMLGPRRNGGVFLQGPRPFRRAGQCRAVLQELHRVSQWGC